MSLAENLLNSLDTVEDVDNYSNSSGEPHIVVDAERNIIVPNSLKRIAVTGDKDIETVTFDCVRYWDGHDLSTFAIYVNYDLPNGESGTYVPKSIIANGGEDVFHFDWKIGRHMTKRSGTMTFSITAIKTKTNENGETVTDKQWGSFPNRECYIVEGLDVSEIKEDEENADILSQISAIVEDIQDEKIPSYWDAELKSGAKEINKAICEAGKNKSAFLFYTDAHWNYGSQMSPRLLKYLYNNTGMTKTIFGGDVVHNEASDYDTMEYLWDWRRQLKDLPNHHSVVGNHDDGNATNNLFSEKYVYGYLFAPEETYDIIGNNPMYYYIDNKREMTRYIYLDTAYKTSDSEQLTMRNWLVNTLKSVQSFGHIVVISHIWYEPDYDQYHIRPIPLVGLSKEASAICEILDNYNARQGDFSNLGVTGTKVEFCIGGHVHRDYIGSTNGGIPIILCETDSQHIRSEFTYEAGTTNEASVSGIIADYDARKVSVIRVGRGRSFVADLSGENIIYYNIDQYLTNASSSNDEIFVQQGEPFTTNIEATVGKLVYVTVVMGYDDITSEVYSNGVVSIPSVTGNVTITAYANVATGTFVINGLTFEFEEEMTWQDFIDSSYNDGDFYISENLVWYREGKVNDEDGNTISPNSVIVSGGTYTYVVPEEPEEPETPTTYTNVIKTSIDKTGAIFNSGKGWAGESRIGSGGIYMGGQAADGYVTGHIKIDRTIDNTFYLKNVTFDSTTSNNYKYFVAVFDSSFARTTWGTGGNALYPDGDLAAYAAAFSTVIENNNIVQFTIPSDKFGANNEYIAICCSYLGDDSIMTINEPIE